MQSVKIESTAGGDLQLLSPWKASKIKVTKDNGKQQIITPGKQNIIKLETTENESIIIQPV